MFYGEKFPDFRMNYWFVNFFGMCYIHPESAENHSIPYDRGGLGCDDVAADDGGQKNGGIGRDGGGGFGLGWNLVCGNCGVCGAYCLPQMENVLQML